jgi:hypothetical protein
MTGEKKFKGTFTDNVSVVRKQVKAWNDMCDEVKRVRDVDLSSPRGHSRPYAAMRGYSLLVFGRLQVHKRVRDMTFSANRLVGSVVYRARKALNANRAFMAALAEYKYRPNSLHDGVFNLSHWVGTHMEIADVIKELGKTIAGSKVKFPCVMNFLPVVETVINPSHGGTLTQIQLNLAICALTDKGWKTPMRELKVFDTILRPVYDELIRQFATSPYLQHGYGQPQHTKMEIYTTGPNAGQVKDRYGDHMDALEIHNLTLTLNPSLCDKHYAQMADESNMVITEFQ